jgi:hypothetical protein
MLISFCNKTARGLQMEMTSGQLRETLAKAMQLVMDGKMSNQDAKNLIGLATQVNKTLELEIKQKLQD